MVDIGKLTQTEETWKPIPMFEGAYECSNHGRVRRVANFRIDKNGIKYSKRAGLLTPFRNADNYLEVTLCFNGLTQRWKIHRLVAFLFIDGYSNELEINHIDFNRQNNYYLNLEYKTKHDNVLYSAVNGRFKNNSNHFKAKPWRQKNITLQLNENGETISEFSSLAAAALAVNGKKSTISRVIIKRGKTAYGFKWAYK